MSTGKDINTFLSAYSPEIVERVMKLQELLKANLPGVTEQLDLPAKMIAYVYGQKYADMVCTLIPAKQGLKLGFYKGPELPDPTHMLQGTGKISRYVEIRSVEELQSPDLINLISSAYKAYLQRKIK